MSHSDQKCCVSEKASCATRSLRVHHEPRSQSSCSNRSDSEQEALPQAMRARRRRVESLPVSRAKEVSDQMISREHLHRRIQTLQRQLDDLRASHLREVCRLHNELRLHQGEPDRPRDCVDYFVDAADPCDKKSVQPDIETQSATALQVEMNALKDFVSYQKDRISAYKSLAAARTMLFDRSMQLLREVLRRQGFDSVAAYLAVAPDVQTAVTDGTDVTRTEVCSMADAALSVERDLDDGLAVASPTAWSNLSNVCLDSAAEAITKGQPMLPKPADSEPIEEPKAPSWMNSAADSPFATNVLPSVIQIFRSGDLLSSAPELCSALSTDTVCSAPLQCLSDAKRSKVKSPQHLAAGMQNLSRSMAEAKCCNAIQGNSMGENTPMGGAAMAGNQFCSNQATVGTTPLEASGRMVNPEGVAEAVAEIKEQISETAVADSAEVKEQISEIAEVKEQISEIAAGDSAAPRSVELTSNSSHPTEVDPGDSLSLPRKHVEEVVNATGSDTDFRASSPSLAGATDSTDSADVHKRTIAILRALLWPAPPAARPWLTRQRRARTLPPRVPGTLCALLAEALGCQRRQTFVACYCCPPPVVEHSCDIAAEQLNGCRHRLAASDTSAAANVGADVYAAKPQLEEAGSPQEVSRARCRKRVRHQGSVDRAKSRVCDHLDSDCERTEVQCTLPAISPAGGRGNLHGGSLSARSSSLGTRRFYTAPPKEWDTDDNDEDEEVYFVSPPSFPHWPPETPLRGRSPLSPRGECRLPSIPDPSCPKNLVYMKQEHSFLGPRSTRRQQHKQR